MKENDTNEQTSTIHDVLTIGVPVSDQDQALEFGVPPMFALHDQDGNGLEIVEAG